MAELGNTGIVVSELSMGALGFGPHLGGLSLKRTQMLIMQAFGMGVNFFDSADFYNVYPYLKQIAQSPETIIAGRSYAYDKTTMNQSLDAYRRGLGRDVVDIFGLHEQESGLTLKGHSEAIKELAKAKSLGRVRATSISTHYVQCVRAAAMCDEIDIIFAILNVDGLGIVDGARQDMEDALAFARETGKGIYLMKALGGGHLYSRAWEALTYVRDFPYKDSVCLGIRTFSELVFALECFSGQNIEPEIVDSKRQKRKLVVADWCQGCGLCVARCGFGAMSLKDGKARPDSSKCMFCGYCARVCPHFCIKVV